MIYINKKTIKSKKRHYLFACLFVSKLLPVYSPDFNSVEFMWAYMKGVLWKLKARTEEALIDAAVQVLNCVTPELIAAWFKHYNYTSPYS